MKNAKEIINYLDSLDITSIQMTLETLLKLLDKLPDCYADDVIEALFMDCQKKEK